MTLRHATMFSFFNPRRVLLALMLPMALWMLAGSAAAKTEFMDPEQAFRFSARMADAQTVEVKYDIADGYYLYRERFAFAAEPATVKLGEPVFPKGEIKFDETFGKNVEHFRKQVIVRIPVTAQGAFTLVSTSQGCADAGLCYPPQKARAELVAAAEVSSPSASAPSAAGSAPSRYSVDGALQSGNLFLIVLVCVGFGLLLSFTPCVLPMVPILSTIIVGDAQMSGATDPHRRPRLSKARGFALALTYALGMALVYTGMGIAAGLAGEGLAATLQKPAVLWAFAALLGLVSLSMFGFYELQIPNAVQSRLSHWSGKVGDTGSGSGRFPGIFLMGALSALIVGPCVAAPLVGALVYISQTRDVVLGGLALFSIAVGMSVPLLLVGLSAGALLPRVGPWMESVKRFFGALLIAVAIWMVSPVIPVWAQMSAWAALLIIPAVYLKVFDTLPQGAHGWSRFWKGVGVLLFLAGAAEVVGVATGGHDVLQPLAHLASRGGDAASATNASRFERVRNLAELDARVRDAGKPVMLDFYADWCVSCKEMERFTYTDPRVAARLGDFLLLQADVTANSDEDRALLKRFGLFGPPGILFFDRNGQLVPGAKIVGYQNADTFLDSLQHAAG